MITHQLIVLFVSLSENTSAGLPTEAKLIRQLIHTDNYSVRARPVRIISDSVRINVGIEVTNMISLVSVNCVSVVSDKFPLCGRKIRKVGGIRYEARSRGRSSPDSLAL